MRIRQTGPFFVDRVSQIDRNGRPASGKTGFADFLQQQEGPMQQEHITRLLQEIGTQGERLARSRTIRDLRLYKSLVKRFMEEAVKFGVGVDEKRGAGPRSRQRMYKMIRELDRELLELTNIVLQQESSTIDILDRIGEIKGMLINLYM